MEWQRPKTTRRYLHPPMSERMYSLWREGRLIFGEIEVAIENQYNDLFSTGMWFFDGKVGREFDFRETEMLCDGRGIPIHRQIHRLGEIELTLEAFSDFGLRPACYVRIEAKNRGEAEACELLGVSLRTAHEIDMIVEAPDIYASHVAELGSWDKLLPSFKQVGDSFVDGERRIEYRGDVKFRLNEERGEAIGEIRLAPGERCDAVFAFNIGEVAELDYEKKRREVEAGWCAELDRIKAERLPKSVREDAAQMSIIENLTVQLLQCFCRPKGESFALCRQGGLQRQVWPFESVFVLESLSRIGDFDDYIEEIIELYFGNFARENGEIVALGIPWARTTGTVLYSFASYTMIRGDAEYFERYADAAYRSFTWIRDTRAGVSEEPGVAAGLFPPLRSSDSEVVFQAWGNTDTFNLIGLKKLCEAFRQFGDGRAEEIEREYSDYLDAMMREWNRLRGEMGDRIIFPHSPRVADEIINKNYVFSPAMAYFVYALDLPTDEALAIVKTYTETGMIRGGLYNRMPHKARSFGSTRFNLGPDGKCAVWYVACYEYYWFGYFLRHGLRDKCCEIIRDAHRYAMTDECVMVERYHQRDPYFVPWSPNASANGRFINMLLDIAESGEK